MLIISRKLNESIVIQENIEIVVLDIQGDKVKIGINAPNEIKIVRSELLETERANKEAASLKADIQLGKLKMAVKDLNKKTRENDI